MKWEHSSVITINQDRTKIWFGLPRWLGKNPPANIGDSDSIPEWGRFPGKGNGNPLHILVWRIPVTEEPGGLKSMGSKRVGHNLVTKQQQKYGLAQTLWLVERSLKVCFSTPQIDYLRQNVDLGDSFLQKSILNRGRIASCLPWKERTESSVSEGYSHPCFRAESHQSAFWQWWGKMRYSLFLLSMLLWFRSCVLPTKQIRKAAKGYTHSPSIMQAIIQLHQWKQIREKWIRTSDLTFKTNLQVHSSF